LLSEAWEAHHSYDIAASLGQVELERGNGVQANELLDYCLANFPPIESDAKLAKMQAARASARKMVAEVEVLCKAPGVRLYVDGRDWGTMPLHRPLYVAPGKHILTVRSSSDERHSELTAVAGQHHQLTLSFDKSAPAVQVAFPEREVASPPVDSVTWPYYVGGAVSMVGLTAAVGFQLSSVNADHRVDVLRSRLAPDEQACMSGDGASTSLACSQLQNTVAERHRYATMAVYTYGVSAAVGIATVVYWLLSSDDTKSTSLARRRTLLHQSWNMGYLPQAAWLSYKQQF
jgi:hypothetical protein